MVADRSVAAEGRSQQLLDAERDEERHEQQQPDDPDHGASTSIRTHPPPSPPLPPPLRRVGGRHAVRAIPTGDTQTR